MKIKKVLKSGAAHAIHRSGLRRLIASVQRAQAGGRRVVVLGYHRVTDDFERERGQGIESCLISQRTFDRHVAWLSSRFELLTVSAAAEVLAGRRTARRDVAAITFDDGYEDVLLNALPVLRAHSAPATLYVSSSVVDEAGHFPHDRLWPLLRRWSESGLMRSRLPAFSAQILNALRESGAHTPKKMLHDLLRDRAPAEIERLCDELQQATGRPLTALPQSSRALDWEGVRELAAAGVEIGAHTTTHAVLANVDPDAAYRDLVASKARIEAMIDRPVRHFAYCNGYYSPSLIRSLRRAGYLSAVTTEDRLNHLGDDPFRIARRVLWEGSARGPRDTSEGLLACQLDGTWTALGFDASESGARPDAALQQGAERLLA